MVLVTGCAAPPSHGLPVCAPLVTWSPGEQDALVAEMTNEGPRTLEALHEWEQLRAVSRSCLQGAS